MRRFVCAVAIVAFLGATAGAITYGVPDGDDHPNVGLLVAFIPDEGVLLGVCSGVLVSPTVFLTAGHCTDLVEELNAIALVTFDPTPSLSSTSFPGPRTRILTSTSSCRTPATSASSCWMRL